MNHIALGTFVQSRTVIAPQEWKLGTMSSRLLRYMVVLLLKLANTRSVLVTPSTDEEAEACND